MARQGRQQEATTAPAQQVRRCRAQVSVCAPAYDYGRSFGPGELVDLATPIAEGVTLRDLVREDWFEAPEAPALSPISEPALTAEEHHDGTADRT